MFFGITHFRISAAECKSSLYVYVLSAKAVHHCALRKRDKHQAKRQFFRPMVIENHARETSASMVRVYVRLRGGQIEIVITTERTGLIVANSTRPAWPMSNRSLVVQYNLTTVYVSQVFKILMWTFLFCIHQQTTRCPRLIANDN